MVLTVANALTGSIQFDSIGSLQPVKESDNASQIWGKRLPLRPSAQRRVRRKTLDLRRNVEPHQESHVGSAASSKLSLLFSARVEGLCPDPVSVSVSEYLQMILLPHTRLWN